MILLDGKDVVPEVHAVLDKIRDFSEGVRSGKWIGSTRKPLKVPFHSSWDGFGSGLGDM